MRGLALFLCLAAFWAVNSGQFAGHTFLIICGAVCCAFTTWVGLKMGSFDRESNPLVYGPRMVGYVLWLMWQIVLSNIDVVRRVWDPYLPIKPSVFKVPCELKSNWMVMTYANSITLTPGTVTIDVEDGEFLIHALSDTSADDLKGGEMHARLLKLEGGRASAPAAPTDSAGGVA